MRVAEDVGKEHIGVFAIGLEQKNIGVRILPAVFLHSYIHPGMDDRPKSLRQHQRQPAVVDFLDRQPAVSSGGPRVERHQGIDAEQQLDVLVERDRRMERLVQRAVDVVFAIDFYRREQARQRRGSCYRLVDRNVIDAGLAECHGPAGVEIRRDQKQFALEGAKVVAAATGGEQPHEKGVDGALVEQSGRNGAAQRGKRRQRTAPEGVPHEVERCGCEEGRHRQRAARELAECGAQEQCRCQCRVHTVIDEQPVHLRRRNAIGQRRRGKAARRDTDVDVEFVQVDAVERFGKRKQRADLVNAAERPAARQREAHARASRSMRPSGHGAFREAFLPRERLRLRAWHAGPSAKRGPRRCSISWRSYCWNALRRVP